MYKEKVASGIFPYRLFFCHLQSQLFSEVRAILKQLFFLTLWRFEFFRRLKQNNHVMVLLEYVMDNVEFCLLHARTDENTEINIVVFPDLVFIFNYTRFNS